ncbi:threonine synthase-like 1 [Haliotis cracherodii]|uniref:threonine synthase-like 1 n=1 Tax=Haliotis cracherodii TaxID=6455 RepID=UPI0039E78FD7
MVVPLLTKFQAPYRAAWRVRLHVCRHLQTDVEWKHGEFANSNTNVLLIGSPGSGKTTVARLLGAMMDRPVVDIDDDHLEPFWNMTVADKLSKVGGDRFLEEEGKALLKFDGKGKIVSLTGSNPMHTEAMRHIAKSGTVFFIDCPNKEIINRLNMMKVNRIVGQGDGTSMEEILKYRRQFYEKHYDVRIVCDEGETPESVANKIKTKFDSFVNDKGYVSTRGSVIKPRIPFFHTVLKGLAEDGGLYTMAGDMPRFTKGQFDRLVHCSYRRRALGILEQLIHPFDLSSKSLQNFVNEAYHRDSFASDDIFPVRHLAGNQYILELFHGPTGSFKDGALQLMPMFFTAAMDSERRFGDRNNYLILAATSGDTGGAVLDGFSRHAGGSGVGVVVLYPSRGISQLQQHQMATMDGDNLRVIGVDSDFDFCQTTVKRIFQDEEFADALQRQYSCKLSAANSLNWGRLLPQIVYHVSGYLDLVKMRVISLGDEIDVCIPTGNFGNILAAYYAKEMGVPVRRLICASNSNNVLTDFLNTGNYDLTSRTLLRTASPAIDILKSSNLERLLYHLHDNNGAAVSQLYADLDKQRKFSVSEEILRRIQGSFVAGSCDEQTCQQTVLKTYQDTGYLLDPHTAVAKSVADRLGGTSCPVLISGTAHYAKFADSVLPFIGQMTSSDDLSVSELIGKSLDLKTRPAMHRDLESMTRKPVVHKETCSADYENVKRLVRNFVEKLNS